MTRAAAGRNPKPRRKFRNWTSAGTPARRSPARASQSVSGRHKDLNAGDGVRKPIDQRTGLLASRRISASAFAIAEPATTVSLS